MRRSLACVASLLFACGGPRLAAYTPLEQKTDVDQKKLYEAVEGTLLDRGYLIEKRDEVGYRIVTEPRTMLGSEISKTKYKYVWTAVTAGGTLSIKLGCTQASGTELEDCGREVPEKMVGEQKLIAEQALKEAKGR